MTTTQISGCFIGGAFHAGSGDRHGVINPATGETVAEFTLATTLEVERAVTAARDAQPEWAQATPAYRAAILQKLATLLERHSEDFIREEVAQTGKPRRLAAEFDVPGSVDNVSFFAGAARLLEGKGVAEYSGSHTSMIRREPVGIVGTITPWNYPLQMAVWKTAPALAAGCAVVIKPSELTPLTTLRLAQLAVEAGVPSGVFNVVTGTGVEVGDALAIHPGIDVVTFTGSTRVGRTVMARAAQRGARVQLELGGKAPFVVFEDADIEAAIQGAVAGALINSGQDCTAATRAIVARPLYEEFIDGVAAVMEAIVQGDPLDENTDIGPQISFSHRDRVSSMVEDAKKQGIRVAAGGFAPDLPGAFYRPTLLADVPEDSAVYREEIFGPVLTVRPHEGVEDALRQANDTDYGLAASVWTRDVYLAQRATREIKAGCVWVNDHIPVISEMPHGGTGSSGFGKDLSAYSLEEYLAIKHVMSETTAEPIKEWHRTVFHRR